MKFSCRSTLTRINILEFTFATHAHGERCSEKRVRFTSAGDGPAAEERNSYVSATWEQAVAVVSVLVKRLRRTSSFFLRVEVWWTNRLGRLHPLIRDCLHRLNDFRVFLRNVASFMWVLLQIKQDGPGSVFLVVEIVDVLVLAVDDGIEPRHLGETSLPPILPRAR